MQVTQNDLAGENRSDSIRLDSPNRKVGLSTSLHGGSERHLNFSTHHLDRFARLNV